MRDDIREIKLKRVKELEKQAALYGPLTDPGILVEIQDIYNQYPEARKSRTPFAYVELDYDFLMNTVAAALKRLTELEISVREDQGKRVLRQMGLNVWLTIITTILLLVVLLQVIHP